MTHKFAFFAALIAAGSLVFAQSMMSDSPSMDSSSGMTSSTSMSSTTMNSSPMESATGQGDASAMTAPPDTMGAAAAMTARPMSYAALKAAGRLADSATGAMLRTDMGSGGKVAFTNLAAAEAIASKGPVVLFFAADWCPSCQADLRDINANGSKLGDITVIVVDYDRSAELQARYGVTAQDSYVRIDAMGAPLGAWNGGGVAGILSRVKSMM